MLPFPLHSFSEQKINLFFLFSQFGEILDIVTKKSDKMRGQAFVVFKDITSATTALKELQAYNLFEKNIVSALFSFEICSQASTENKLRKRKIRSCR